MESVSNENQNRLNVFPVRLSGQRGAEANADVLWGRAGEAASRMSAAAGRPARQKGSSSGGRSRRPHEEAAGRQASHAFLPPAGGVLRPTPLNPVELQLSMQLERDDHVKGVVRNRKESCRKCVIEINKWPKVYAHLCSHTCELLDVRCFSWFSSLSFN